MTTRADVFAAVKAARGGKPWQGVDIQDLDTVLDRLGVPRDPGSIDAANDGTELPADYWPMLAKIESGNRPYIKAATSSGSGLYQFIRSSWIGEGGTWGSDMSQAFGGLKPSEAEQLRRAVTFTEKNAEILRKKGVRINRASLYAAHFLGAGTAAVLLAADVTARADQIAGANATAANPSILRNKTVGQFLSWLHDKTGEWAK